MVRVVDLRENRVHDMKFEGKIKDLMERLGYNPNLYVILKNKKIVTEEETVGKDDTLELIPVVSGG